MRHLSTRSTVSPTQCWLAGEVNSVGIVNDRGRYCRVKRVPKRFAGLVCGANGKPVSQVRQALYTDSLQRARVKAARLAEWEAMPAGDSGSARRHCKTARKLAQARGISFHPVEDLTAGDITNLVNRMLTLAEHGRLTASPAVTGAVLSTVPKVMPTLPEVLNE